LDRANAALLRAINRINTYNLIGIRRGTSAKD
jgi:hypothetical protein